MRSSAIAEIKMDEPKAENRMNGRPCVDGKDGKAFQQQTQLSTGVWKRFLSFRTEGIFLPESSPVPPRRGGAIFAPPGQNPFTNHFVVWNGRIRRVPHAAEQIDGKAVNGGSTTQN